MTAPDSAADDARVGVAPTLVAVAHGSREVAARAAHLALVERVRLLAAGVPVRAAFLEHAAPLLDDVVAELARRAVVGEAVVGRAVAELAGRAIVSEAVVGRAVVGRAVVVPVLLSAGYHAGRDIAARAGSAVIAPPLGPAGALTTALADRLAETGAPADAPVVLAAAGSSDARGAADVARQAALLRARRGTPVVPAYAAAGRPTVGEAVAELTARTGRPVAVATYLLAPGRFADRVADVPAPWVSRPLGDHLAVAGLVLARYREACSAPAAA